MSGDKEAAKRRAVEQLRARALARFAGALGDAGLVYEQELERLTGTGEFADIAFSDVERIPDFDSSAQVVTTIVMAFLSAANRVRHEGAAEFLFDPADRRKLDRLYAALRPPNDRRTKTPAFEVGQELVDAMAPIFLNATPRSMHPPPVKGVTKWRFGSDIPREDLAQILVGQLTADVHVGFRVLRDRLPEVCALLERWMPRRQRGRPKGTAPYAGAGKPTKLSAVGILTELNHLAGSPLKWTPGSKRPKKVGARQRSRK